MLQSSKSLNRASHSINACVSGGFTEFRECFQSPDVESLDHPLPVELKQAGFVSASQAFPTESVDELRSLMAFRLCPVLLWRLQVRLTRVE